MSLRNDQAPMIEKRVVYRVPQMDQVAVRQDVEYRSVNDVALGMDIYYPPGLDEGSQHPAIVFVFGYRDSAMLEMLGSKLKDIGQYVSWGELLAASGIVGITYETKEPHSDVQELIEHIRRNAITLRIDPDRLGLWSCSGNVPTALSILMDESKDYLRCAVLYYGFMLDWGIPAEYRRMLEESASNIPVKTERFKISPRTYLSQS